MESVRWRHTIALGLAACDVVWRERSTELSCFLIYAAQLLMAGHAGRGLTRGCGCATRTLSSARTPAPAGVRNSDSQVASLCAASQPTPPEGETNLERCVHCCAGRGPALLCHTSYTSASELPLLPPPLVYISLLACSVGRDKRKEHCDTQHQSSPGFRPVGAYSFVRTGTDVHEVSLSQPPHGDTAVGDGYCVVALSAMSPKNPLCALRQRPWMVFS